MNLIYVTYTDGFLLHSSKRDATAFDLDQSLSRCRAKKNFGILRIAGTATADSFVPGVSFSFYAIFNRPILSTDRNRAQERGFKLRGTNLLSSLVPPTFLGRPMSR